MDSGVSELLETLLIGGVAGLAVVIVIVFVLRRLGYAIKATGHRYSDRELKTRIKEKTAGDHPRPQEEEIEGETVGDELTSSGVWKIVDEVDGHIARKEYDLAEKWASIAASSEEEEERLRAQLQLAEIYYLTRRNDAFLEIAAELAPKLREADEDWSELLSTMGRKIDPENPLFAPRAASETGKKSARKSRGAARNPAETSDAELLTSIDDHIQRGQYRLAEKLIAAALYGNPVDAQVMLKLKLAEVYFHTDRKPEFKKLAGELFAELSTKDDWRLWERMMEMGHKIDPKNPLFINTMDETDALYDDSLEREISTSGIYKILDFVESLIQENEYRMAEQWARKAVGSSGNNKAKLLLAKIYYLTDRKDQFLKLATDMAKQRAIREDKNIWKALSDMGRDVDPENRLFKA